jgi:hypothetical protein
MLSSPDLVRVGYPSTTVPAHTRAVGLKRPIPVSRGSIPPSHARECECERGRLRTHEVASSQEVVVHESKLFFIRQFPT